MEFYKDRRVVELKVGLFTLIGLLILIISYSWFTEFTESKKYTEISVKFSKASGVEMGSPVTILGIKKGRVKSIELDATGVKLGLQVILDFPLAEDSQFFIDDTDLMGDAEIEIRPGSSSSLLDYTALQMGSGQFGMSMIFAEVSDMLVDLKEILSQINQEDGLIASTKSVLDSSKAFITNVNVAYKESEDDIVRIINNIETISENISSMVSENKDTINKSVEDLAALLAQTELALAEIESTTSKVGRIADNLNEGEGSAQSLMNDKELYENLKSSAAELENLLRDVKSDPKKYFKFSVF